MEHVAMKWNVAFLGVCLLRRADGFAQTRTSTDVSHPTRATVAVFSQLEAR
jgi:hypothetical protein